MKSCLIASGTLSKSDYHVQWSAYIKYIFSCITMNVLWAKYGLTSMRMNVSNLLRNKTLQIVTDRVALSRTVWMFFMSYVHCRLQYILMFRNFAHPRKIWLHTFPVGKTYGDKFCVTCTARKSIWINLFGDKPLSHFHHAERNQIRMYPLFAMKKRMFLNCQKWNLFVTYSAMGYPLLSMQNRHVDKIPRTMYGSALHAQHENTCRKWSNGNFFFILHRPSTVVVDTLYA